ncbi:MAG: acyl-ACP--UDP-N-acetylglucosamine O-acyltransferase [Myxococcota bacterium]|nr:acyl-ACP--UDP-N-acetylglucosamine O-acyltransferase [Myxococcota bacterium]
MSVHSTAIIDDAAELADDVEVGPWVHIGPGVQLHAGVRVGSHAVVEGPTVIGPHTQIFPHAVIGGAPQDQKFDGQTTRLQIGEWNVFREFSTINRGTTAGGGVTEIGDHNLFMAYSHVAHDCRIGNHCVLANSVALAGHVEVHDHVVLGGLVGVHQHGRIGRCAMVGGGAMAAQDVPPFTIAQGDRARLYGLNIVGLRRNGFEPDVIQSLKRAYREVFHQGLPLRIALEQVRTELDGVSEVQEFVRFMETSTRGVCRSAGPDTTGDS